LIVIVYIVYTSISGAR